VRPIDVIPTLTHVIPGPTFVIPSPILVIPSNARDLEVALVIPSAARDLEVAVPSGTNPTAARTRTQPPESAVQATVVAVIAFMAGSLLDTADDPDRTVRM
jgi:hypothetical protein